MRRRIARTAAALACAAGLVAPRARAGDPAAAETLFDEGKRLMAEGLYEQACSKFDESQKTDPGLGTQFHLADCWQHLGRDASAWALFREVASEARERAQFAREHVASDRAAVLEPHLSKLVISPHEAAITPALVIERDGRPVGREQWGVAIPVDPGEHTVTVRAPGKRPWETTVNVPPALDVAAGKATSVATIDVPALADVADLPSDGPPAPRSASVQPPAPDAAVMPPVASDARPAIEPHGGVERAIGWFAVGAGAAGLAAGAYFVARLSDDLNEARALCAGDVCGPAGARLHHDADVYEVTAIATASAGGAGVLLGALLAATAPGPRIVTLGDLRLVPQIGPRTAAVDLRGAW